MSRRRPRPHPTPRSFVPQSSSSFDHFSTFVFRDFQSAKADPFWVKITTSEAVVFLAVTDSILEKLASAIADARHGWSRIREQTAALRPTPRLVEDDDNSA